MKLFIIAFAFILCGLSAFAQQRIVVETGDTTMLFQNLNTAITQAPAGSTIYIPGGSFALSTNIDKKLHIIGVGYRPDSSNATGFTLLNGDLRFVTGGDSSTVTGIKLNGQVFFGTNAASSNVSNVYLYRNEFLNNVYIFYSNNTGSLANQILLEENIIRGYFYGGNSTDLTLIKNIIYGSVTYASYAYFFNNIILFNGGNTVYNCTGTVFNNNIFTTTSPYFLYSWSIVFQNNLFVLNQTTIPDGAAIWTGNIINQPLSSIFQNYVANDLWQSNLHLNPESPGVGAGLDGTDVGIYGTGIPFKEGGVPLNPHIKQALIAPQSENGGLQIQFRVQSQER